MIDSLNAYKEESLRDFSKESSNSCRYKYSWLYGL